MQPSGWRYREITIVRSGESIAPLARLGAAVDVALLLPPAGAYLR